MAKCRLLVVSAEDYKDQSLFGMKILLVFSDATKRFSTRGRKLMRLTKFLITASVLVAVASLSVNSLPSGAYATEESDTDGANIAVVVDEQEPEQPEISQYGINLAHPISIDDAILAAAGAGIEPMAYRFENQNFAGEFSPATGITTKEFLE